jgi:hypothetical protein
VRSNLLSCRRSRAAHGGRFRGISNSGEYRTDKNQGPEVYRQRAAEDGYKSDEAASSSHSMIKKKRDPCCHGSLRSVRRYARVLHLLSTVALRHQFRRFSVALCRTNAPHRRPSLNTTASSSACFTQESPVRRYRNPAAP